MADAFPEQLHFKRSFFFSASSPSLPERLYANQISLLLAPAVLQRVGGGEERGRGGKRMEPCSLSAAQKSRDKIDDALWI